MDAGIRQIIRSKSANPAPSSRESWFLLAFGIRMAALAVREQDASHLADALAAVAIEGGRIDLRENLQVLALIYHSAEKIGADAQSLFDSAPASNPELGAAIREFPRRAARDRSIEAMGFRESGDAGEFLYQRVW
jgi:hypothetical protein